MGSQNFYRTTAINSNNERAITEKLSTRIKCSGGTPSLYCPIAGQIVVLYEGKNVEVGNHESLTASCGKYYELMKNQLEIGN